jgi:uncharacterized protein YbjT (DUF2867 family)
MTPEPAETRYDLSLMPLPIQTAHAPRRALVTGATGYIGGRLIPRLLEAGWSVRCLARHPEKLADRPWANHPAVEIVSGRLEGGVRFPAASRRTLRGTRYRARWATRSRAR